MTMCDHCGCREYAPIAELTAEHVTILGLAEALAAATDSSRPFPSNDRERLRALLISHARTEELGLYPLLIAQSEDEPGAYDHLEEEHRDVIQAIDSDRFDHLALYALQRHIEEEDEGLFTRSTFYFDGDTWDAMDAAHRLVESGSGSNGGAAQP